MKLTHISLESEIHPDISSNPLISVYAIATTPNVLMTKNAGLFLILGPLKVVFQICSLWLVLGYKTSPAKWIIVQVSQSTMDMNKTGSYKSN